MQRDRDRRGAGSRSSAIVRDVLERAADPEQWERFERQLRSTGYCRRPIRLRGRVDAVDLATGEVRTVYSTDREPDETLLKCCGNRREAVCPSCARDLPRRRVPARRRRDARRQGRARIGRRASVRVRHADGAELRARALAPRDADGKARRCRPRRKAEVCRTACGSPAASVHDEDDPRLGEPLCARLLRLRAGGAVERAGAELWRRTAIQMPRELARLVGTSERKLRRACACRT